jgi:hypothetical protein
MFKVSEFSLIVGNDTKNKARSGFGNTLVNYYNNIFFQFNGSGYLTNNFAFVGVAREQGVPTNEFVPHFSLRSVLPPRPLALVGVA